MNYHCDRCGFSEADANGDNCMYCAVYTNCEKCGGTGSVVEPEYPMGGGVVEHSLPCAECGGHGGACGSAYGN